MEKIRNIENVESFDEVDEKTNKDMMDLVFVLDKSGSMYDLVDDTIGGFNSLIEKQKKEYPDTLVTLVLFNESYKVIYEQIPIEEVEELNSDVYYASGCTALLDAVGTTINMLDMKTSGKVLFAITTDGLENSSREYKRSDIKKMIENHDWEFIFMGADIDAFGEAGSIGIDHHHTLQVDKSEDGMFVEWRSIDNAVRCISNNMRIDKGEWKEELDD